MIVENIEGYKKYLGDMTRCFPNSGEMVSLYNGLIEIWRDSKPDDLLFFLSIERLSNGLNLIDENKINKVDFTNSSETAVRVFGMMSEKGLRGTETLNGLSAQQAVEVIRHSLKREDRHQNVVIKWILKPSFMNLIEKVKDENTIKEFLLHDGFEGFDRCPLCNAPPGMAIVDIINKMEQRFLSCCFCGFRWPYPVTGCPECHNDKPEKMSFFVGDSACEQGTRALCCDECKRYIKTVFLKSRKDRRGFDDLDMDIEDVATIPLDIMASERGYIAVCQSGA